jgi:hypothetical protein
MKWKGFGRKRWWLNFKVLPGILLKGWWKTTKNLSQDSRSPSRDLNLKPPEYEA